MAGSMRNALFHFQSSSLDEDKSKEPSIMRSHYFTRALTVTLPGASIIPNPVLESFSHQLSYRLHKLPLYRLLEMPFVQAFVKKGNIYVMSVNTKNDTDDCVVVAPSGLLLLHLTKDTYQELGLEARKQTHAEKKSDTYVVKINLLADSFRPGKKGYNRVVWCLKERLDLTFDFLVSWEPHDESICSSSVGVYFMGLCHKVERVGLERTSRIVTSLSCPRIDVDQPEGSENSCHHHEVFEWMGALACGVDMTGDTGQDSSYVSTFSCPEPWYNCPRLLVFQVSGFITPQTVLKLWTALREYTSSHSESFPSSLTAHGFSDCPITNKTVPHNFYICGDNLYSLILLPNNRYWSYTASVS